MRIKILNWEKYNPRHNQTKYSWLRFENRIFDTLFFSKLSAAQKSVFMYLLCEVSKRQGGVLDINIAKTCHFVGCCEKDVSKCVEVMVFYEVAEIPNDYTCEHTPSHADTSCDTTTHAGPTIRYDTIRNDNNNNIDSKSISPSGEDAVEVKNDLKPKEQDFLMAWNSFASELAGKYKIKKIESLTPLRLKKLRLALKAGFTFEKFKDTLEKAKEQEWLLKECKSFGFDFIFQQSKTHGIEQYQKILEMAYSNSKKESEFNFV